MPSLSLLLLSLLLRVRSRTRTAGRAKRRRGRKGAARACAPCGRLDRIRRGRDYAGPPGSTAAAASCALEATRRHAVVHHARAISARWKASEGPTDTQGAREREGGERERRGRFRENVRAPSRPCNHRNSSPACPKGAGRATGPLPLPRAACRPLARPSRGGADWLGRAPGRQYQRRRGGRSVRTRPFPLPLPKLSSLNGPSRIYPQPPSSPRSQAPSPASTRGHHRRVVLWRPPEGARYYALSRRRSCACGEFPCACL